jgi:predicted O-linked N-acetylglucosamine transferase (SPINDLY family)
LAEVLGLHRAGRLEEAERGYRAIVAATGHADAMQLLATLLHQRGQSAEALDWLDRALPHLVQRDAAESNRSAILLALGRHDDAVVAADTVLARSPKHAGARRNRELAMLARARACHDLVTQTSHYAAYFKAGGGAPEAHLEYGNVLQNVGAADVAIGEFDAARAASPQTPELASAALIAAHFDPVAITETLSARARDAAALYAAQTQAAGVVESRDPAVFGFYSPRFADGPIASLVLPVLRALRAQGGRIALYSGFDHDAADASAYREVAHVFREVGALDDAAFAAQVAADLVGVMFDLCGHAPGNRLRAFATRLAPVQVSWGDWFCTTGTAAMDVFIGDAVTTPPEEDAWFTERVVRLPTRFVYACPGDAPRPMAHAPDDVCFASFNRLSKLTAPTCDAWARILQRVPDATLLLRSGGLEQAGVRDRTAARFEAHGVDASRLRFEAFGSYRETLARYRDVRVALDPFPFNGCVTTFDALAMQVPVVALRGHSLVARQSAALLTSIDCREWIADDIDAYVETAVALADADANARARQRLAAGAVRTIFDVPAFAELLVAALASHR